MFFSDVIFGGLTLRKPNSFVKSVNSEVVCEDDNDDDKAGDKVANNDEDDDDDDVALETSQRMTRARKEFWRRANSANRVAVCVKVRKSPWRGVVMTTMSMVEMGEEEDVASVGFQEDSKRNLLKSRTEVQNDSIFLHHHRV